MGHKAIFLVITKADTKGQRCRFPLLLSYPPCAFTSLQLPFLHNLDFPFLPQPLGINMECAPFMQCAFPSHQKIESTLSILAGKVVKSVFFMNFPLGANALLLHFAH